MAVFVFLLWHLHWRSEAEAPEAMEVALMRSAAPSPRQIPRKSAKAENPGRRTPPLVVVPQPASPRPTPVEPAAPAAAPPAAPIDLAKALRGSLGCGHSDYLRMTPTERRACETRMAGRAGSEGPAFGMDPGKRAAFDLSAKREDFLQRPFLAERPTKGCKPTVTEHESGVVGRSAPNWTVGVACVIPF